MGLNDKELTILHVEDDPTLNKLVRLTFTSFGFNGTIILAEGVKEALALLDERERNREPVNLIITDMRLPDGTGLDVIREVKTNPAWRTTPALVLSSEVAPGTINAAYALGANCYLPKISKSKSLIETLRALYINWLESPLLPQASHLDRMHTVLFRSVELRARTAEFYMKLARLFDGTPEIEFWLNRALTEGNLSNLLAFFLPVLSEKDASPETIDRCSNMQLQVKNALEAAEACLQRTPAPRTDEVYRWVLDFMDALDEEVVAEVTGCLFPKGPEATTALRARAAVQLKELASHILERTKEPELCRKAGRLLDWAGQIVLVPNPATEMQRSA